MSDASLAEPARAFLETASKLPYRSYDEELGLIASVHPEYSGHYLDEAGRLVVLSTQRAARERIAGYFRDRGNDAEDARRIGIEQPELVQDIEVLDARYGFLELYAWRDQVRGVMSAYAISMLDLDEQHNRIHVGLAELGEAGVLQSRLTRMGIPADALHFSEVPYAEHRATLSQYNNSLRGGLKYSISGTSGDCSIGIGARLTGGPYAQTQGFLVNSHCTKSFGAYDGGTISQASGAANVIGGELVDIQFTNAKCPPSVKVFTPNAVCRLSDAAFIAYDPDANRNYRPGEIYKTSWSGQYNGSKNIVNNNYFEVMSTGYFPLPGTVLHKVGYKTGWTHGPVTGSCIDLPVAANKYQVCQVVANLGSDKGDSSSPVFFWDGTGGSGPLPVTFYGLVWGGPPNNTQVTYISPYSGIVQEIPSYPH